MKKGGKGDVDKEKGKKGVKGIQKAKRRGNLQIPYTNGKKLRAY
jgi:hypothetical protein